MEEYGFVRSSNDSDAHNESNSSFQMSSQSNLQKNMHSNLIDSKFSSQSVGALEQTDKALLPDSQNKNIPFLQKESANNDYEISSFTDSTSIALNESSQPISEKFTSIKNASESPSEVLNTSEDGNAPETTKDLETSAVFESTSRSDDSTAILKTSEHCSDVSKVLESSEGKESASSEGKESASTPNTESPSSPSEDSQSSPSKESPSIEQFIQYNRWLLPRDVAMSEHQKKIVSELHSLVSRHPVLLL